MRERHTRRMRGGEGGVMWSPWKHVYDEREKESKTRKMAGE